MRFPGTYSPMEDIERLAKMLDEASRVVLVNGLGGIGKTVLDTAYV